LQNVGGWQNWITLWGVQTRGPRDHGFLRRLATELNLKEKMGVVLWGGKGGIKQKLAPTPQNHIATYQNPTSRQVVPGKCDKKNGKAETSTGKDLRLTGRAGSEIGWKARMRPSEKGKALHV